MNSVDLNNIAALREALDYRPKPPTLPTMEEYRSWTSESREHLDGERSDYVLDGLRVNLPVVQSSINAVHRVTTRNKRTSGGRQLVVLDGHPFAGKTQTALACARSVEAKVTRMHPDHRTSMTSVVWLEVPSGAGGRGLSEALLRVFVPDLTPPRTWRNAHIQDALVDIMAKNQVKLVVLDEAHRIHARAGMGKHGEASDNIKEWINRTTTTVLMAGADMLKSGVFTAERAKQLLDRSRYLRLEPYTRNNKGLRRSWVSLCASFDDLLPLIGHAPGILAANEAELHRATDGILGNLAELVGDIYTEATSTPDRADESVTPAILLRALETYTSTRAPVDELGRRTENARKQPIKVHAHA